MIRFATLCSGIEGVSAAWEPLGDFKPVFFSENGKFQSRFLATKFPDVPNLGDINGIDGAEWCGKVDVLWASTPCQSYSQAGNREALLDPRGQITLKYVELVDEIKPTITVWENVKGALSAKENAFGQIVGSLCGFGQEVRPNRTKWERNGIVVGPKRVVVWRVFDAAFSGLAARRERIFLVAADRGSRVDPAKLLFERTVPAATRKAPVRPPVNNPALFFNRDATPKVKADLALTMRASDGSGRYAAVVYKGEAYWLDAIIREHLLGFPPGYTDVSFASEAMRCSALGNSVALPDVRWIGQRIKAALTVKEAVRGGFGTGEHWKRAAQPTFGSWRPHFRDRSPPLNKLSHCPLIGHVVDEASLLS